jgi:hypothetical protein
MDDQQLTTILREARVPENPMSARELLRKGRQRHTGVALPAIAAVVLLTGALAVGLSTINDSPSGTDRHLHARGVGEAVELGFSFAVEGRSGLADNTDSVSLDQTVIFIARSSRPGYLCIDEEGDDRAWQRVFPKEGEPTWKIEPGEHHIQREGKVQAFVTELGAGLRRYRLAYDPQSEDCSQAKSHRVTELLWTAP